VAEVWSGLDRFRQGGRQHGRGHIGAGSCHDHEVRHDTCAVAGRVEFGSDAWDVFDKANREYGEGIPVLIYPTHRYGDPDKLCDPGFVPFRAGYLGTTAATKAGKHPNPVVRPQVTISGPSADSAWTIFWEINDLVQVPKSDRIAITTLTAEGQTKLLGKGFVPHGPMLVKALFL
jgi:hypothetical protein